jgi:hypothetical protein
LGSPRDRAGASRWVLRVRAPGVCRARLPSDRDVGSTGTLDSKVLGDRASGIRGSEGARGVSPDPWVKWEEAAGDHDSIWK